MLQGGDAESAVAAIRSALSLWRGSPLPDSDGADYALAVIDRIADYRIQALCDLFDAYALLHREFELVAELEEAVVGKPPHRALTGRLTGALAAAGRTAEALARYEDLRIRLAEDLGVDPDPRLREQHLSLLRGEPTKQVRQQGQKADERARSNNIPATLTGFLGRDVELRRVDDLLRAGRLVTIAGPGGAGKTRPSMEAATAWRSGAADGVWLVELAPVTEPANIAQAVLAGLGVGQAMVLERRVERRARDSMDRLLQALDRVEVLLILDNCEHLIGAVAPLVVDILARCPGVKVLATSREPLGVVGEALCLIPPLGLPPADADAAEAVRYPAVELLLQRAEAVSAGFQVTDLNARDVVETVRRLDGMPLAIELAAARVRVLPIAQIASRLHDRFRLLSGGNRAAMPRHRTLEAVVEWSRNLLSPDERLLAERLSVFPVGATEVAAEAVCGDDRLPAEAVGGLLLSLVDKSLLQVVSAPEMRFRMLETIREHGTARLAERAEADAARAAHARYFAALMTRIEPVLRGSEQLSAVFTLRTEHDNILTALRYLGDSGDLDRAVDMALRMVWPWIITEQHSQILSWTESLLLQPGVNGHPHLAYHRAAEALSTLASRRARHGRRQKGPAGQVASAGTPAGSRASGPGRPRSKLAFFTGDDESGALLADELLVSQDAWVRAAIRVLRANLAENRGDATSMRSEVDAALGEFEVIGDRWVLANALNSRAWLRTMDGDPEGAVKDYERSLAYLTEMGGREDDLLVHLRLSGSRLRLGDVPGAQRSLDAARGSDREGTGSPLRTLLVDGAATGLAMAQGDFDGAKALCDRLRSQVGGVGSAWMRTHGNAITLAATAAVALRCGDVGQALADARAAYPFAAQTQDMPVVAFVGVGIAGIATLRGDPGQGAFLLGASARLRGGDDFTDPLVSWVRERIRAADPGDFSAAYAQGRSLSRAACITALDPAQFPG